MYKEIELRDSPQYFRATSAQLSLGSKDQEAWQNPISKEKWHLNPRLYLLPLSCMYNNCYLENCNHANSKSHSSLTNYPLHKSIHQEVR